MSVKKYKHKIKHAEEQKSVSPNTVKQNRLELLITIVNRSKTEFYLDLLQSFEINTQFIVLAHGTANETMRRYIGLTDSEKSVIFGIIQEDKISDAFNALDEKFRTIKNGNGIAYTIPLSSVIGKLIYTFLSNNRIAVKEIK